MVARDRLCRFLGTIASVLPGLVLCAVCIAQGAVGDNDLATQRASRIHLSVTQEPGVPHPITLDEIVSFREIHEPRRSPDGTKIAFTVKQAFRDCDCYRVGLYVVAVEGAQVPTAIIEAPSIDSIRWRADGSTISYLTSEGGVNELYEVSVRTHVPARLVGPDDLREAGGAGRKPTSRGRPSISSYEWSHDGRSVAIATTTSMPAEDLRRAEQHGIRFDDRYGIFNFLPSVDAASGELWVYSVQEKRSRLMWQTPMSFERRPPLSVAFSPDDRNIAFVFYGPNAAKTNDVSHIGVVNPGEGRFTDLVETREQSTGVLRVAWSPSGEALAAVMGGTFGDRTLKTIQLSTHATHIVTEKASATWGHSYMQWRSGSAGLLTLLDGIDHRLENTGLYSISLKGEIRRLNDLQSRTSECDALQADQLVCVVESPSEAPTLALINTATGALRRLSSVDVNPELKGIRLGKVEPRRWKNKYGAETNGYLVYPVSFQPGKSYPLIVMNYAFDGEFVTHAGSIYTSWPAQVYANDGYAVLLINTPQWKPWVGNDFQRGGMEFGFNPLASLEAIVQQLSAEGLVDPHRVGFTGHSWGGFWVEFALTHSKLLRVAEMVNGGTVTEPGSYWFSGFEPGWDWEDHIMGGPPWGNSLKNYESFSPTLLGDRVTAPMLIQASGQEAQYELQMYTALRRNGRPVELVIYHGDGHTFTSPEHRFHSMDLNRDWFEFWLSDREDPDPAKAEQYARWKEMRRDCTAHGWCPAAGS